MSKIGNFFRGLAKVGTLANALPVGSSGATGQYNSQWQALKSNDAVRSQDLPFIFYQFWSNSVVDPELKCYDANNETVELPNHPVNEVIETPNEDMDWSDLQQVAIVNELSTGTTYLHKRRDAAGIVRELMPYSDANITPVQTNGAVFIAGVFTDNSTKWISHYLWRNRDGVEKIIPKEDIILLPWIQRDPAFMQKGLSPMLALTGQLSTDNEFTKLIYSLAYNGAYPGVVMGVSGDEVLDTDVNTIAKYVQDGLTGDNRGRTLALKGNVTMARVQSAISEIAIELPRMITETRASACFMVPAISVGLYAGVANTRYAADKSSMTLQFFTNTLCPKLNADARKLTKGLKNEYPGQPEFVLKYDYSKVDALHERSQEQQARAIDARKAGILSLAESRDSFPVDNEPPPELVKENETMNAAPKVFSIPSQQPPVKDKTKLNGHAKRPAVDAEGNLVQQ